MVDRDLFPAIAEFLHSRRQLKSLQLVVSEQPVQPVQHAVGFDATIWVLPSLEGLEGLKISYPSDLSPASASWLIPKTVLALSLAIDYNTRTAGDSIPFLKVCIYSSAWSSLEFRRLISLDLQATLSRHAPFPQICRSLISTYETLRPCFASFTSGTATGQYPKNTRLAVITHLKRRE